MERLTNEFRSTDIPIIVGDESVVIGIHQRGLLVQSLPLNGQDSRFYLLDKDSYCLNGQSKFTYRVTDIHVLHVFIRIHSTVRIPNILVHEAQIEQKSDDSAVFTPPLITVRNVIDERVETYSMDSDLLRDNYPLIRGSHHTRTRKQTRKERRKLRNRHSNTSVSIVQQNKAEIPEDDEDPLWTPFDSDLVALVVEEKDRHGLIRVVGTPSHRDFLAKPDIEPHFNQNQFIKAKYFQADSFFELSFMFNTLCVVKNYEIERLYKERQKQSQIKYEFYQQKMLDGLNMEILDSNDIKSFKQKCLLLRHVGNQSPPMGDCFLYKIQELTRDEDDKIRSCCREKKHVRFEEAKLLIRDPAIAINRNKSYLCKKESREFSIVFKIKVVANGRLQLNLSSTETRRILRRDTPWYEGAEMKIWHRIFQRQKKSLFGVYTKSDADVIVDEIITFPPDGGAQIYLRPAKQCKDLFDILKCFNKKIRGEAKVGPSERDGSAENEIMALLRFSELLKTNRTLFDHFRCFAGAKISIRQQNPSKNLKDKISESPIHLDQSQEIALAFAFRMTGIVCIQAPPGSGKTMVIGSLINNLQSMRGDCRVVLTATTNKAVNNAVEKAVNLEINGGKINLSITRETSKRGEIEITDNIKRYVLLDQALRQCVEPTAHPILQEAGREYFKVKQLYEAASNLTEKLSLFEMKHDAESNLKRYYLATEAPFVRTRFFSPIL